MYAPALCGQDARHVAAAGRDETWLALAADGSQKNVPNFLWFKVTPPDAAARQAERQAAERTKAKAKAS